jgi:hypothetical protein
LDRANDCSSQLFCCQLRYVSLVGTSRFSFLITFLSDPVALFVRQLLPFRRRVICSVLIAAAAACLVSASPVSATLTSTSTATALVSSAAAATGTPTAGPNLTDLPCQLIV